MADNLIDASKLIEITVALPFKVAMIKWCSVYNGGQWWCRSRIGYTRFDKAWLITRSHNQGPDSIERCYLTSIGNPIVEIRRSYDRLISTMGFPIPVRWYLYIESGPNGINITALPTKWVWILDITFNLWIMQTYLVWIGIRLYA